MDIVLIGSGRVASHLAQALKSRNLPLIQLYGRNTGALEELSKRLDVPCSTTELKKADLYIISVSDSAISEVSRQIPYENALVAHTSGSLPTSVLEGPYRKASFYPLQTFSLDKEVDFNLIPLFVEAEDRSDLQLLMELGKSLSPRVMESSYEKRKYIHLTAVFACNFVNHLYSQAKDIADSQEIPFEYFHPLIEETFKKILTVEPKLAQTGPAVRNDLRVLRLHEELISDPNQLKIYHTINQSIQKMYGLDT